ncbi:FIST signal transduction protein [Lewinella cohaerens]|uniref:FIST signal transduction protein n=1 Tax=Lewinella cohaerens TaxID=70995 RepID=UPI00036C188D|nr:FIST N-terminal domain-containing protein [Lewinella cohaerens]
MKTHSFQSNSIDQLKASLTSCQENEFQPNLAVVFCSKQQNIEAVRAVFVGANIDLVGCSTAGEIVDAVLYEGAISVLLFKVNTAYYQLLHEDYLEGEVYEASAKLAKRAIQEYKNPALIIMSGGLAVDAEQIIKGIRTGAGRDLPTYGGLAGDDLEMRSTTVFTNHRLTDQGLVALVLDTDKLIVKGLARSGWAPVGGVNTITKAVGNVIYTINGERAYDVFIRYFGISKDRLISDPLISIQTNYPLQILRGEGTSILRSPILVNEKEGSLTLAGGVIEGEQFQFSNSPGFEIIDQTIEEFGELQKNTPEAEGLILFSCKGRHGAFGPMLEDEIKGIYDLWGQPMIGFLSYGEFGDDGAGRYEFHNETCALVILKEK